MSARLWARISESLRVVEAVEAWFLPPVTFSKDDGIAIRDLVLCSVVPATMEEVGLTPNAVCAPIPFIFFVSWVFEPDEVNGILHNVASAPGLELGFTDPKSAILPLDEAEERGCRYSSGGFIRHQIS